MNDYITSISADGRTLGIVRAFPRLLLTYGPAYVFDRRTRRSTILAGSNPSYFRPQLSGSGRHAAITLGTDQITFCRMVDLVTGLIDEFPSPPEPSRACVASGITDAGQLLFGSDLATLVAGDSNAQPDAFVLNRDPDGDGMLSSWETVFGLSPGDPADAAVDSDGDGVTNLVEFHAATHPRATLARYFAEGATNAFFSTSIDLYNPTGASAAVVLHALGSNLESTHLTLTLPPGVHQWIRPGQATEGRARGWATPADSFAITLESDQLVVMEREVSWDRSSYGSHGEVALEAPGLTWYFAEGATHGGFDSFYLLQNPGTAAATVTITFLRPAPLPAMVRTYAVLPRSRRTIYVDQEPGLAATDVSAIVQSDLPILAERAMYFSTPSQAFAAGTASAGVPAPRLEWYLGEGATGSFFDCYILLANPSETSDASVEIQYLLPNGSAVAKTYTVPARSRRTISVDDEIHGWPRHPFLPPSDRRTTSASSSIGRCGGRAGNGTRGTARRERPTPARGGRWPAPPSTRRFRPTPIWRSAIPGPWPARCGCD